MKEVLYCPIFLTDLCMSAAYWSLFWQSIGVVCSILVGGIGAYKIYVEVSKIRNDKEDQKKLEQTKFFLEQHRRLFDDETLFEILSLIDDSDTSRLADVKMIDKKRKFLTFLEEIAILHNQNLVDPKISFYMFGYYAKTTRYCRDFWVNFDESEVHWGMFYQFVKDYEGTSKVDNCYKIPKKKAIIAIFISAFLILIALWPILKD